MDNLPAELIVEVSKTLTLSEINNLLLTNGYLYSIRHIIYDEYNKSLIKKHVKRQHTMYAQLPPVIKTLAKIIIDELKQHESDTINVDYDTVIFNYDFTYYTRNGYTYGDPNHMASLHLTVIGINVMANDGNINDDDDEQEQEQQQNYVYKYVSTEHIPVNEHGLIYGTVMLYYTPVDMLTVNDDNDDVDGMYRAAHLFIVNNTVIETVFYGEYNYYIHDLQNTINILVNEYNQTSKSDAIRVQTPWYNLYLDRSHGKYVNVQFVPTTKDFTYVQVKNTQKHNKVLPVYHDDYDQQTYNDKPPLIRKGENNVTITTHHFMTFTGAVGSIVVKQRLSDDPLHPNAELRSIQIVSDTFELLIDNLDKAIVMTEFV